MKNSKKTYKDFHHWEEFFPEENLKNFFNSKHVSEVWIPSAKTQIHLDVYTHSKKSPTVIFCHGLATSGRIAGHLTIPIFEKGYNIIAPDLVGFGLTTQKYGSGTIPVFIQNLLDCIDYAHKHFEGPVYMTGISLGGCLTYYTSCLTSKLKAIASINLMDFSSSETHAVSHLSFLVPYLRPMVSLGKKFFPGLTLPLGRFLEIEKLSLEPIVAYIMQNNPLAHQNATFGLMHGLISEKPAIPFEKYDKAPILVLHSKDDRLIPESLSKSNYDKILGTKKYIPLKECGHVLIEPHGIKRYVDELDDWFKAF